MKLAARLALATAIAASIAASIGALGCAPSAARAAQPTQPAAAAPAASGHGAAAGEKIDRSGTALQQLARLQDAYDRNAEAIAFLNRAYAAQKAQAAEQERSEPADDAMFAVDVSGDIKAGQVDGPASAPVTVVKAFDFACPYCQRMAPMMKELVAEYGGKVRVVYANLLIHPPARPAHLASCAAAKQGKYLAFKDAFWDKGFGPYAASGGKDTSSLEQDNIVKIAKEIKLDAVKLVADMASPECSQRLETDMAELQKWHVEATPTFFINGHFVSGALPKEQMKEIIDAQLKIAEASGVPGADYYDKVVLAKGEKQFRSKSDPKPN
jgi:protein-disulfide isomerase